MKYDQLLQLYFERSNSLQWYWTIYVVVIGGLLAFSSLRQRPDFTTGLLVTILYIFFAYKNCGAIGDVTAERFAILDAIKSWVPDQNSASAPRLKESLEPTLQPPTYASVRNFHITCDVLTVAALWAMEWRRLKAARASLPAR
jgi:hypothetical protein